MSLVLQRMAVLQAVPDAADENDPDTPQLVRLSAAMPADETQLLYSLCLQGRMELGLAPDEYAALTMVLLRLLAFKPGAAQASAEKKTLKTEPAQQKPAPVLQRPAVSAPQASPLAREASLAETTPKPPLTSPVPAVVPAQHVPSLHEGRVLPVVQSPNLVNAALQATSNTLANQPQTEVASQALMPVSVRVPAESRHDMAAQMAAPVSLQATEEGAFWQTVVQELMAQEFITALVRELALQSQLVARDAGHWLLRVERESLNQGSNRDRLQQALQAAGHEVQLSVEIGRVQDSPAKRATAAAQQRQQEAERLIHSDPQVQALMADFGAKILSIKPI
jgi:DNA polymerase-3 subunit gamma/tau